MLYNQIIQHLNLSHFSKKELITILQSVLARNEALSKQLIQLAHTVEELEQQVLELKTKKDSNNSSIPASQNLGKARKNKSLQLQELYK